MKPGAEIEDAVETRYLIGREVYHALCELGAPILLLAIVGSYGDTLSDVEVLDLLRDYNERGEECINWICSVSE